MYSPTAWRRSPSGGLRIQALNGPRLSVAATAAGLVSPPPRGPARSAFTSFVCSGVNCSGARSGKRSSACAAEPASAARTEASANFMIISPWISVRLLFFAVLAELARPNLAAENVALRVDRHALCRTRAFHLQRIRDAVEDLAARGVADADAAQPAGIRPDAVRLGVGDVDAAVAQRDAARAAELLPFGDEVALRIEDLDAMVAAVGDDEPATRVQGDVVRRLELDRAGAKPAEGADELALLREARDARHGAGGRGGLLAGMAFGDEEIAVGGDDDAAGLGERAVLRIAGDAGLADRHQHLAVRVELDHGVAGGTRIGIFGLFSFIHAAHVDHPDVSLRVLVDLVREHEQPRAEALQDVPVRVELGHRLPARAGAAVVLERGLARRHVRVRAAAVA